MKKLLWLALATLLVGCTPLEPLPEQEQSQQTTQEETEEAIEAQKAEVKAFQDWVLSIKDELTVTEKLLVQTELMANGRYVANDWVRLRTLDDNIQDYYTNIESLIVNHDSVLSSDEMFKQVIASCIGKKNSPVKLNQKISLLDGLLVSLNITLPTHPNDYNIESYELYDVIVEVVQATQPIYVPEQYIKFVKNPILLGEIGFNVMLEVK